MSEEDEKESALDQFFTRFAEWETELGGGNDGEQGPRLPDGRRPRGLVPDGLVRTTGWLQVGDRPVSSGLLTAMFALLVSVVLGLAVLPNSPVLAGVGIVVLPAVGYGIWRLSTGYLLPASAARNIGTAPLAELPAGSWVRVHGSIGPVGQVALTEDAPRTSEHAGNTVMVMFVGGLRRSWPGDHRLHLVEVLD